MSQTQEPHPRPVSSVRPVLFGEVLFDRFPEAGDVLGGAPLNVAWHLQAFGLRPLFISRVGDDALGRDVLARLGGWGLDTSGVQVDGEHPTGAVEVRLAGGEPSYEILAGQAYDHIDAAQLPELPAETLLYHGTLALRGPTSRAALEHLRRGARPRRLVDVNLRAPWWQREAVLALLEGAERIKLNEEELGQLLGRQLDSENTLQAARELLETCGAERLIVTRGERGAQLIDRTQGLLVGAPTGVTQVVDTVGAGDAFTAVLMLGECLGWGLEISLQRGLEFAEAVVGMRGATTGDRAFYFPFTRRWTLT